MNVGRTERDHDGSCGKVASNEIDHAKFDRRERMSCSKNIMKETVAHHGPLDC